jgi:hypothetical protein
MRNRIAATLTLAFGVLAAHAVSSYAAGTLTGREVLDLDGAIARKSLQAEAGVPQQQQPQPQAAPQGAAVSLPAPVRQYEPARTVNVLGVDASALGGPLSFIAFLRWNDHEFPVRVGTEVNGYRVTHIDPADGTDLTAIHGKGHLHLARQSITDTLTSSVPIRQPVQPAPQPPIAQTAQAAPNQPAVSVMQGSPSLVPFPPTALVGRTGPAPQAGAANLPGSVSQESGGK